MSHVRAVVPLILSLVWMGIPADAQVQTDGRGPAMDASADAGRRDVGSVREGDAGRDGEASTEADEETDDEAPAEADEADPCPPPRAVVDRAGRCCEPGQRSVGQRCAGAPTSCAPGATMSPAGACEARALEDSDAGVGARLYPPRRATPAPAGQVVVPGGVFRAGGLWVSVGPFSVDATEVSAGEYGRCVAAGVCAALPDPFGQMATGATAPVVNVTWRMAARYCGWAGGRLPTEHEWELAARGLDGRRFPWGERAPDCTLARHAGCGEGPLRVGAAPAGRGPFGLIDAVGNVAEWTADRFAARGGRDVRGAIVRDPTGAPRGRARVVRGGSFASTAAELGLEVRRAVDEREARADVGFRCARGR